VAEQYRGLYEGVANGKVAFEGSGCRAVRGTVDAESAVASFAA
jgi:hypothetical protein